MTPQDLAMQVAKFIDRNGRVLEKQSTPQSVHLKMVYETGDIKADLSAYQHAQGNGSTQVRVTVAGKEVFKASGDGFQRFTKAFIDTGAWMNVLK